MPRNNRSESAGSQAIPSNVPKPFKSTFRAGTGVTVYQISWLACELSRKPDGTVDRSSFKENFAFAFEILTEHQAKLKESLYSEEE